MVYCLQPNCGFKLLKLILVAYLTFHLDWDFHFTEVSNNYLN